MFVEVNHKTIVTAGHHGLVGFKQYLSVNDSSDLSMTSVQRMELFYFEHISIM